MNVTAIWLAMLAPVLLAMAAVGLRGAGRERAERLQREQREARTPPTLRVVEDEGDSFPLSA